MTIIFSVEGNIGSGKSTLIKQLKKHMKIVNGIPIVYLEEPVDIWQQIKDEFQMMAYITRITQLRRAVEKHKKSIIITERSILTDRNVFAKMLHENKTLDEISHQIYLKWFDELSRNLKINSLIYIKTKPETSLRRVLKRNRHGETIGLDYLQINNNLSLYKNK